MTVVYYPNDSIVILGVSKHLLGSVEASSGGVQTIVPSEIPCIPVPSADPDRLLPVACASSGCLDGFRHRPGTISGIRSRRMRFRIARDSHLGTATSTIWQTMYQACVTTSAPILMSSSQSIGGDQCLTDRDRAKRSVTVNGL